MRRNEELASALDLKTEQNDGLLEELHRSKDEVMLAKHFPFDDRLDATELKPWVPPGGEYRQLRKFNGSIPEAPELELKGIGELDGHLNLTGELFEANPEAEWHTDGTDQREDVGPPVYTQMYCPEAAPLSGGETMFASAFRVP